MKLIPLDGGQLEARSHVRVGLRAVPMTEQGETLGQALAELVAACPEGYFLRRVNIVSDGLREGKPRGGRQYLTAIFQRYPAGEVPPPIRVAGCNGRGRWRGPPRVPPPASQSKQRYSEQAESKES